jgi:hypothetical protein
MRIEVLKQRLSYRINIRSTEEARVAGHAWRVKVALSNIMVRLDELELNLRSDSGEDGVWSKLQALIADLDDLVLSECHAHNLKKKEELELHCDCHWCGLRERKLYVLGE